MGGIVAEHELLVAVKDQVIEASGLGFAISHRILDPTLALRTIADKVFSLEISTEEDRDFKSRGQTDVPVEDLLTLKFCVVLSPEDEFESQLEAGRIGQRLIKLLSEIKALPDVYCRHRRTLHAVSTRREWYLTTIQFTVKRRIPLDR